MWRGRGAAGGGGGDETHVEGRRGQNQLETNPL